MTDVYRVLRAVMKTVARVMTMTEAREVCLKHSAGDVSASGATWTAMASEKDRESERKAYVQEAKRCVGARGNVRRTVLSPDPAAEGEEANSHRGVCEAKYWRPGCRMVARCDATRAKEERGGAR